MMRSKPSAYYLIVVANSSSSSSTAKVSPGQAVSREEKKRRESNESPALFLYHLWTAKTTQRGTQKHNRRTAAGSNGVLRWTGEGGGGSGGQRYERATVTWAAAEAAPLLAP